ncbi:hypothetical protein QC763_114920 [Podospora pseudopauciseta]|uniref:Uncharacterized protein n=1 Tax=Podospora pseudopauciseta TaxID=2093780 RepID=A0ABR0I069_9PEZI|nr:hypothetical protein QC763_114920 [Podospora pseudopauciseta]
MSSLSTVTMRSSRLMLRRAGAQTAQRNFFQAAVARHNLRARPDVPFLSVPSSSTSTWVTRVRHMTTERRAQLRYEILTGIKYVGYIWIAGFAIFGISFAYFCERNERDYPTTEEWSFMTRFRMRMANIALYDPKHGNAVDWIQVGHWIDTVIKRLHDPEFEGAGLKDAPDGPKGTKDITAKSEEWRRAYFDAMMFWAKAAEHMEGWVWDTANGGTFPPGTMIGPSNPYPKPVPPGFRKAPREEDCILRHDNPNEIYLKILNTVGFTDRQKIDAGLAYGSWLEYKGIAGPASIIYEDALHLALKQIENTTPAPPLDPKAMTLNEEAGLPSENLLNTLTAYADFRARQGDINFALPVYISLLKARRSLPLPSELDLTSQLRKVKPSSQNRGFWSGVYNACAKIFTPPPYPEGPGDGIAPPIRNAAERCQEAALSLHIGEIMYATNPDAREEGLSWTREAVDVAEEQLHKINPNLREMKPVRRVCRDCLVTGLENWAKMVARLQREEQARREELERQQQRMATTKENNRGWFGGLWGERQAQREQEVTDRWSAEEKVIEERQRRVKDFVEDLRQPDRGWLSFLKA